MAYRQWTLLWVAVLAVRGIAAPLQYTILDVPRGGGNFRKNNKGYYLRALAEEVLWLEQQLRRVESETRALKQKQKKSKHHQRTYQQQDNAAKAIREEQRQTDTDQRDEEFLRLANLERLEAQHESLLSAKKQLESVQADCENKLKALDVALVSAKRNHKDREAFLRAKVLELQASLEKAALVSLPSDDLKLTKAVREACDRAIAGFWEQAQLRLRKHEEELRARQFEELEQERKSARAAVDKQKEKMRALARATAIRETALFEAQKKEKASRRSRSKLPPLNNSKSDRDQQEKLRLKAIREEAERRSKAEEERLWIELERGLQEERDKLERQRKKAEEERKRCELEELERQRILQQHAMDLAAKEEEQRKQQQKCDKQHQRFGWLRNLFGFFGRESTSSSSLSSEANQTIPPQTSSIQNYRQSVPWQPIFLPPKEVVRISPK